MSTRIFDDMLHERFARASRDFNPIHMDAVAARRTLAGERVVHGIHTLLWLLDVVGGEEHRTLRSLKAQFRKPVYIGDQAAAQISVSGDALRARVLVDGNEVLVATLGFAPRELPVPPIAPDIEAREPVPVAVDLGIEEMAASRGRLALGPTIAACAELFPRAARLAGARPVAALAAASCVVGMELPGLHSLFRGVDVVIDPACESDALGFAADSVDPRFRLVKVAIDGGGLKGFLETLSRPPPLRQASMRQLAEVVTPGEFSGTDALVVGGSRGLGELTAKLIAAGGGRVVITYAAGKADAESVAEEIRSAGGRCETIAYDVRSGPVLKAAPAPAPSRLYYFATPTIARRKAGVFDVRRFTEFNTFYVTGFLQLVQESLRSRAEGIKAFYPSTSFIDSRPADMTEYAMSKAAAEVLCTDLQKSHPKLRILTRRLPRVPTDQTSSVLNIEADPVQVMLPVVREMQGP